MKTLHHLYARTGAIISVVLVFIVPTFAVWYWGDWLGMALTYGLLVPSDPLIAERVVLATQIFSTIVFFLLHFVFVTYPVLRDKYEPPYSQAVVSDLMLSREQFKMLYDSSPVPYFLIDDEGNIHNPNQAALRFWEGTSDALLMKNFFSLVLEQSVSKGKLGVIHAKVEHQVPVTNEKMRIKTLEGNEKWVLTTIYSLDAKSPVPYKHLVTLVETQAPEHQVQA